MFDQRRQHFQRVRTHDELVVLRTDVFRDAAGIFQLAKILLFEANRECFNGCRAFLRHQRYHCRRIDTAREKRSQRDLRDQPQPGSFANDPYGLVNSLFL